MAHLITSQNHIDQDIVAAKVAAGDFEVQVSPEFVYEGETYQVILDGHHSYAAALEAGVTPDFVVQSKRDNDRVALLERGDVLGFLEACWHDGDYRYAADGSLVW